MSGSIEIATATMPRVPACALVIDVKLFFQFINGFGTHFGTNQCSATGHTSSGNVALVAFSLPQSLV